MSNAAVERGRVNNALDKLRQVEAEFSKFQLDAANEKRKLQQQSRFLSNHHHVQKCVNKSDKTTKIFPFFFSPLFVFPLSFSLSLSLPLCCLNAHFSEDRHRSEAKIQELEKLLHEAEKRISEQDIQISSAQYQDKYCFFFF
jgi:hypothetical protein